MPCSTASRSALRPSLSSTPRHMAPPMPQAPKPISLTRYPVLPSGRVFMFLRYPRDGELVVSRSHRDNHVATDLANVVNARSAARRPPAFAHAIERRLDQRHIGRAVRRHRRVKHELAFTE